MIPGWPYSVVAALEPGRTSWMAPLDTARLGPDDDETEVTAAQVREVVGRLIAAGHWRSGDPDILVVSDAGYDIACPLAADLQRVGGRDRAAEDGARDGELEERPALDRDHRHVMALPVLHVDGVCLCAVVDRTPVAERAQSDAARRLAAVMLPPCRSAL